MYGPPMGPQYPPQPQPPRRQHEVFAALGIGSVVVMLLAVRGCVRSEKNANARAIAESQQRATREAEDRARATEEASELRLLQTACGTASVTRVPPLGTFVSDCRARARDMAMSPASVSLPGIFEDTGRPVRLGCEYRYKSWFDAKNAFGVPVRHRYICALDPRTNYVSVSLEP